MRPKFLIKLSFLLLLAAVATLVLAVAGCGGGDSEDAIAVRTGSLTKGKFTARADAICEQGRKRFERLYKEYIEGHNRKVPPSLAEEVVDTLLIPTYEKQIRQISSLGVPPNDKQEVASILEGMQQVLSKGREDPLHLMQEEDPFHEVAVAARAYGFAYCPT